MNMQNVLLILGIGAIILGFLLHDSTYMTQATVCLVGSIIIGQLSK
jgi:hypothetical protein